MPPRDVPAAATVNRAEPHAKGDGAADRSPPAASP
jgi:hypothetical protein